MRETQLTPRISSRRLLLPLVLGMAHGVADGAAGLLLGALPHSMILARVALLVLLYNALAFGSQPLLGLLVDRLQRPRLAAIAGLLLIALALLISGWQPVGAVILAGVGSAAFHIGGGALALCATAGRASGPGLFAAPGVLGLAIGGALAVTQQIIIWPFLLGLLLLAALIARLESPPLPYGRRPDEPIFEEHDLIMVLLLAAIALRSAVWTTWQFLLNGQMEVLLFLALAAATGKVGGGLLADWLGWRRFTVGALLAAAPLLSFGGQSLPLLCLGVALLQAATPAALAGAARLLPQKPATAAGLALGLAVAIGGLPVMVGMGPGINSPSGALFFTAVAAAIFWWVFGPRLRVMPAV